MILLLIGCVGAPDKDAPPDALTTDGLTLELGRVATVIVATWETATATRATLTATFADGELVLEEEEAATSHRLPIVGVPPLTEVQVHVEADGVSADATLTTGPSPAWVPAFTHDADIPDAVEPGYTLAPVILQTGGGVVALDERGRAVWSWPPESDGFPGAPFRARLSQSGEWVLYNQPANSVETLGYVAGVWLDGGAVERIPLGYGAHTDFVEYTPGGYASLGWDIREVGSRKILGDTVIDVTPDGVQRVVWSVWDDFSPNLDETYPHLYPEDPDVEDWTHINSITYDADDDAYYITMTFNNGVGRIDRESGALTWWVSDYAGGDFTNVDGLPFMTLPHSVQRTPGGLTVFSRGNPSDPDACSEVVDLALDEATWEASRTWSYAAPDCLLVTFLGSAERLPGGNTVIAWTSAGQLDEVTADGALAWQVSAPIGAAFGFSEKVPRLGP